MIKRSFSQVITDTVSEAGVSRLQLLESLERYLDSEQSDHIPEKPKMFEYELENVFKDMVCHLNRFGRVPVTDPSVFEEMGRTHLSTLSNAYSNIGDWELVVDDPFLTVTVRLAPENNEDVGKEHKCIIFRKTYDTDFPWDSITHNTPSWWPIRNLEYH